MLSASARPYIEASVPVLREGGVAITRRFYSQMFAAHPELENLFNLGNQANGSQQGALAAAVVAYAANIDRPEALAPVIERIAHKHASVGIRPAHYPIVARHLLGAIRDVLGEAATPELLAAWDEAYWLLAGELIAAEARLYERAAVEPGSFVPLRVVSVAPEGSDAVSYCLQTLDGRSPGTFRPGQYVSVAVDFPDGRRQLRQYSLSDAPTRPSWRITVKRESGDARAPAGRVSNFLHASVATGDTVLVSAPFGNFAPALEGATPIALLSAGVGITPLLAALHALEDSGSERRILFAHAARSPDHQLFASELSRACERLPNLTVRLFYEQQASERASEPAALTGRMALSSALVEPFLSGEFYLCGPLPFMREQWRALLALGASPVRLHREVFGPELLDHLA